MAFDGLLQLLQLDMSKNFIRTIPIDAFTGLVSLRGLDLSHNQLKKLDNKTNGVLDDCLSLETVNCLNVTHTQSVRSHLPVFSNFSDKLESQQIQFHHIENVSVQSMGAVSFA